MLHGNEDPVHAGGGVGRPKTHTASKPLSTLHRRELCLAPAAAKDVPRH
jgi:hypothetical protein